MPDAHLDESSPIQRCEGDTSGDPSNACDGRAHFNAQLLYSLVCSGLCDHRMLDRDLVEAGGRVFRRKEFQKYRISPFSVSPRT